MEDDVEEEAGDSEGSEAGKAKANVNVPPRSKKRGRRTSWGLSAPSKFVLHVRFQHVQLRDCHTARGDFQCDLQLQADSYLWRKFVSLVLCIHVS